MRAQNRHSSQPSSTILAGMRFFAWRDPPDQQIFHDLQQDLCERTDLSHRHNFRVQTVRAQIKPGFCAQTTEVCRMYVQGWYVQKPHLAVKIRPLSVGPISHRKIRFFESMNTSTATTRQHLCCVLLSPRRYYHSTIPLRIIEHTGNTTNKKQQSGRPTGS